VNSGDQHNFFTENSFFVFGGTSLEINSSDGSESDNSLRSVRSLELNKFNSNDNLPQVLAVCCLASFKFELEPADNFDWQHFLSSFSARRIHKKDRTIASKVTMS